jgi:hypothetical protein
VLVVDTKQIQTLNSPDCPLSLKQKQTLGSPECPLILLALFCTRF